VRCHVSSQRSTEILAALEADELDLGILCAPKRLSPPCASPTVSPTTSRSSPAANWWSSPAATANPRNTSLNSWRKSFFKATSRYKELDINVFFWLHGGGHTTRLGMGALPRGSDGGRFFEIQITVGARSEGSARSHFLAATKREPDRIIPDKSCLIVPNRA
jgi:hypothetical protein